MSLINTRIGVPSIFLPVDDPLTIVPPLSSLTVAASSFNAAAVTPDAFGLLLNDLNQPLLPTDTYQVIIGLVAIDPAGGYTVGACSPSTGNITVTTGQVIQVTVKNNAWPANFTEAVCAAVFLKTNAGNYQLAQFAYIPPSDDFSTFIKAKPLRVASSWTSAVLQSFTADPILGTNRSQGYGVLYPQEISPTTGTFTFRRAVTNVTVSPNNGADFQIATTRSVGIQFQSLVNDIKAFVQAAGGNFVQYTTGGRTYKEAHQALSTASAILKGNKPILIFMPADSTGTQEIRLLIGNLTVNQTELEEAWSKSADTPVSFRFDPAATDNLVTNQHTEINYYLH